MHELETGRSAERCCVHQIYLFSLKFLLIPPWSHIHIKCMDQVLNSIYEKIISLT